MYDWVFVVAQKNFNRIRQTKLWSKDQILFSNCVLHFPLCKSFPNKKIRKYIISENWLELTRKFMDPFKKITYFHKNAKPPTFHEMALFIKVKPPFFFLQWYKICINSARSMSTLSDFRIDIFSWNLFVSYGMLICTFMSKWSLHIRGNCKHALL